jgi:hypothetical protein
MSRPQLEEFTVGLAFNADGSIDTARYIDREGCGWEGQPISLATDVGVLARTHLRHCQQSHDMRPKIMCPFTLLVDDPDVPDSAIRCVLEQHGVETRHRFEI